MADLHNTRTEDLLDRARRGDASAVGQLLGVHRRRLSWMIRVRMDERLSARIDPSDVVQEALVVASQRLPEYLRDPPLPFYPWLRQIAWDRVIELQRRHIRAGRRTVNREEPLGMSENSAMQLADRLVTESTSPLQRLLREELRLRVRNILAELAPEDREILLLRHVEQLSGSECAAVLAVSEPAANKRYLRALDRLRCLLKQRGSRG